jgi:hypothetical protein
MRTSVLLVALLTGCSTIDHRSAPADWPQLEEKILYVNGATLFKYCESNLLTDFAFACSRISFERRVCYIIMPEQTADGSQPWLLAHEREHCAGKDHKGSTSIADAWEKWKGKEAIRVWQSPR